MRRESAGRTRGRNDRLRGHMGVKRREETEGWIMEPPEESE